jgi:hypothetical protein
VHLRHAHLVGNLGLGLVAEESQQEDLSVAERQLVERGAKLLAVGGAGRV